MSEDTLPPPPVNDAAAAASVIETTSRLAWATSAFAFSVGGMRFVSPEGETIDAILGLVVGGAAAYLALALNRVPEAVVGAKRIALVAGIANGLMLPLAAVACFGGAGTSGWAAIPTDTTSRVVAAAIGMTVAVAAAALPWAIYAALRTKYARQWFESARFAHRVPAGIWVNNE
ncbi:MAG: hypothetical protein AAFV43_16125 [Planctomycetota bacterium]